MSDKIKVFISYSHDNEEHCAWVLKIATHLRSHGIDVLLDKWHLRLGDDLGFFMEQGLNKSKYVLCICSENYVNKANSGVGGAGYEKMIMTQDLIRNANSNYVVPIIRNNATAQKTPICFGSKVYIDFCDDNLYYDRYTELLERFYDQDVAKTPSIGENPFDKSLVDKIKTRTRIDQIWYHAPNEQGIISFRYDNNNGVFNIGTGEYLFNTRWSRAGNDSIHAYGNIGFNHTIIDFPRFEELEFLDFSSNTRTIRKGQIIFWRNSFNNFVAVKIISVKSSGHGFPYDEMEFEYKVYGINWCSHYV